jgi:DNA-binding transcriptional ArsR family regulator
MHHPGAGVAPDPADSLDPVFEALASRHRREIVRAVALQPHSISQLAQMRGLSLPAIHKHIAVLEDAGLVTRRKVGRTNFLTLDRTPLAGVQDWLRQFHTYWGTSQATLENYETFLTRSPTTTDEETS